MKDETMTMQKILQGRGVFIEDIMDKDALVIKVKRSRISRGRIKGLVFPELPKNVTVIRAKDIPGKNSLSVFGAQVPILSSGRVQYKGEPVLLLAGPDEKVLEDLIEQIVIDYEEEEADFRFDNPKPENIFYTRIIERGKDPGGETKPFTQEFTTGIQEHFYAEPHGAYVRWNEDTSSLHVLSSSRWPFHVHKTLCEVLALPRELVSVAAPESPDMSLGGKLWYPSLMAAHAGLAAWLTRKNIKVLFSREEDFLNTPKSSPAILRYAATQDKEGNLIFAGIRILINSGAYAVFAHEIADRAAFCALGAYHCPNVRIEVSTVRTNLPPTGPFIGMGGNLSLFAVENLAETLREQAKMNPLDWKKLNLFGKTRASLAGILPRDNLPPPELFDTAARISDFSRKHSAFELARKRRSSVNRLPDYFRGVGIALGCQGSGFLGAEEERLSASLELSMDTEGKVLISQSTVPGSYALHEIWKTIAAESLGTPLKDIHIAPVYTEGGKDTGPSVFSRGITIMTRLLEDCCELLKKKRFRSPLPLSVSKNFRLPAANTWDEKTFTGVPFIELSWAAAIVELSVDPLTFVPEIEGIWMVVDGGKILNADKARKSLETAAGAAIGWAMFEHIHYVNGEIPRNQFTAYRIPTSCDIPTPRIEFLDATGKQPVKGIGELAQACIPAAYVNALTQALGLPFLGIPVSLEGK
ncbi:MAG: xanthine dehydrogenase family protein molybdopterin-binding subunit [Spirochaetales bacterium]|jgi:CO/xanthine dehydrogenase Mo-binding subunit|nr:xanthine dehydrogenase family protein molybdopterin-binding subunit [Spirochaetales bacterium]